MTRVLGCYCEHWATVLREAGRAFQGLLPRAPIGPAPRLRVCHSPALAHGSGESRSWWWRSVGAADVYGGGQRGDVVSTPHLGIARVTDGGWKMGRTGEGWEYGTAAPRQRFKTPQERRADAPWPGETRSKAYRWVGTLPDQYVGPVVVGQLSLPCENGSLCAFL